MRGLVARASERMTSALATLGVDESQATVGAIASLLCGFAEWPNYEPMIRALLVVADGWPHIMLDALCSFVERAAWRDVAFAERLRREHSSQQTIGELVQQVQTVINNPTAPPPPPPQGGGVMDTPEPAPRVTPTAAPTPAQVAAGTPRVGAQGVDASGEIQERVCDLLAPRGGAAPDDARCELGHCQLCPHILPS